MSKLSKYLGKSKTVKIGDEELEIKPLTVKELPLIIRMGEDKERPQAMKELIQITLKKAVPDATQEEIDGFGIQYFNELIEAVMDVNNLKVSDKKQAFLSEQAKEETVSK